MSVKEGESVAHALIRLRRVVDQTCARPSHKRRYGYYEKPSELERKREKMRKRQIQAGGRLCLNVDMTALFRRTGPANALMR